MSNTSNFDFCVQFGLPAVKEIFHLALKNEELFPHSLPPFERNFGGQIATLVVSLLDDETAPADLAFQDEKHIRFSLPIEIAIEIPGAPDPSLSRVTLEATIEAPGALVNWPVDGEEQLGIDFVDISAADVDVSTLSGLPMLDATRFERAMHARYGALSMHSFTLAGNTLNLYDGTRDLSLVPPNQPSDPEITVALETHQGKTYLRIGFPIHADITVPFAWSSYGTASVWREVVQEMGTVSVLIDEEPSINEIQTQIVFDAPGGSLVANQLKPLLIAQIATFAPISEPWFTESDAAALLAEESARYLQPRRFPFYTPRSGDPDVPLETPVGFLLVADGVLAILMNRRSGTANDDVAPDTFLGSELLAMAIGRAYLDETIAQAIDDEFPGIDDGGHFLSTAEGDATLKALSVTPSDPGAHGRDEGHLWVSGEAEIHIDCWPDPDIDFDGPIYLRLQVTETDEECTSLFEAEMGEFDAGQSCCDIFVDLLIPIVGWIMLGVIENMIDKVGGELAEEFAGAQERQMQPIPTFVLGVAELQACLEECLVSSQGLVLPGKLRIRRVGTSFEDLASSGNLPRP